MRKIWMAVVGIVLVIGVVVALSNNTDPLVDTAERSIYFLNFKPEIAQVYDQIAKEYEALTGVTVKVVTAASGTYEQTLRSEIAKADAPTIFQVNGPIGLVNWSDYCVDLSDSEFYQMLSDPSMALTVGEQVLAVPYAVEGYGIIYRESMMNAYFALQNRETSYQSMDEIQSFDALKAVVEDMSKHAEELGIQGVFASTSMASGNQWRWQTHLLNIPLYYEWRDMDSQTDPTLIGVDAQTIELTYEGELRQMWELYTNNSTTASTLLSNKTVDDSMSEFALGQCVMVQNGNWGASQILDVPGNTVLASDMKFLPIYIGVEGEESQGLCIGTENYLCINNQVSAQKQEDSLAFLQWLFESEQGKTYVRDELGFIAPFHTFGEDDLPEDPLSQEVIAWMNKEGVQSIPWTFASFPSEAFKDYVGDALLQYAQGDIAWDEVVSTIKTQWTNEK